MKEAIITGLKPYILANINPYIDALSTTEVPLQHFTDKTIQNCYPDLDTYKGNAQLFIMFGEEEYTSATTTASKVTADVKLYLTIRGAKVVVLQLQALRYADALKKMLRSDCTWGGMVPISQVTSGQYYDAIEGSPDSKCYELTLTVQYIEG